MNNKFAIDTISRVDKLETNKAQNINNNFTPKHRIHQRVEILYTPNVKDSL